MLVQFKNVTAENEDNNNLNKWLGLLVRFNKGRSLPKELNVQIGNYFDYTWAHDRNYATQTDIDKRFLNELPKGIIIDVRLLSNKAFRYTKTSCSRTSYTALGSTSE